MPKSEIAAPEDPLALPEPRPFRSLFQDGELLPEGEILGGELGAVGNGATNQNKDNPKRAHFMGLPGC